MYISKGDIYNFVINNRIIFYKIAHAVIIAIITAYFIIKLFNGILDFNWFSLDFLSGFIPFFMVIVISTLIYKKLSSKEIPDTQEGVIKKLRLKSEMLNSLANLILLALVVTLGTGFYLIVFDERQKTQAEKTSEALSTVNRFMTNRISNLEDSDKSLKDIIGQIRNIISDVEIDDKEKIQLNNIVIDIQTQQSNLGEAVSALREELNKAEKLSGLREPDAGFFEAIFIKIGIFIIIIFSVRFLGNRAAELRNASATYQRNADYLSCLSIYGVKPKREEVLEILEFALLQPKDIGKIDNSTITDKIPSLKDIMSKSNKDHKSDLVE